MSYKVAGIDIHKKVLMVVIAIGGEEVADPAGEALEFECRRFGTGASDRQELIRWLKENTVLRKGARTIFATRNGSRGACWPTN